MGMDVYGTREDTYFRNNIWGWRPLWNYVNETCDLSDEDFNMGLLNDDGPNVQIILVLSIFY